MGEVDRFVLKQETLMKADELLEGKSSDWKEGFHTACALAELYVAEMMADVTKEANNEQS